MEMLGNDDGRPEQRVGVRVRRGDVTVRVRGEDLPLTLGVERAARVVGIGRSSMYASVKRGDFETIEVNGRIAVLTLPLLRRIGWTCRTSSCPSDSGTSSGRRSGVMDRPKR